MLLQQSSVWTPAKQSSSVVHDLWSAGLPKPSQLISQLQLQSPPSQSSMHPGPHSLIEPAVPAAGAPEPPEPPFPVPPDPALEPAMPAAPPDPSLSVAEPLHAAAKLLRSARVKIRFETCILGARSRSCAEDLDGAAGVGALTTDDVQALAVLAVAVVGADPEAPVRIHATDAQLAELSQRK